MFLRYIYLLFESWPRIVEMFFWPMLEVVIWGFFNNYVMQQQNGNVGYLAYFLPAVILWNSMVRTGLAMLTLFLEEMWSRNLGHLFASPLKPGTYIFGLMQFSVLRMLCAIGPCILMAGLLFHSWLTQLGAALPFFIINLAFTGWALGLLVASLLLRYGQAVEWIAWFMSFILLPISAVYYPVLILPPWLQTVSWCVPSTYIFEAMRTVIKGGPMPWDMMLKALALNVVYLIVMLKVFFAAFEGARKSGGLLQMGE
jgi:ABC-2 type transport system permease protein